ncbi:uncharacterized protein LOC113641054 isoform X2 [Tachysurus fulvidraco]|uniref:uncharacterized protein LOC113641054 isoform X2 n=1 Tax=Tachysurus fulvidraco TaxID=1234273 RepID=UPI001FEE591D|nr:uncharacterized protein LOC113641054 isoform X2 [Tachysurus fulvidraco]
MYLTPLSVFIWELIFCYRIQAKLTKVQLGTDVTLSCEVSDLLQSSTVQWQREDAPVPNTTLVYNNTAYIILHNVDHRSNGNYYCTGSHQGKKQIYENRTLEVTQYAEQKKYILYRESSNSSNLTLNCKSKKTYSRIKWTRKLNQNIEVMITAEKSQKQEVYGAIIPEKPSSTFYNGNDFIFQISPVKFNSSGTYKCIVNDNTTYSSLTLHTLREPAVMIRNQSVVLSCELSDVTEQVTLSWLKMEKNGARLIKRKVLTPKDPERRVSVTLNSVWEDLLLYQCVVFNESTLRAVAPVTLHLIQSLGKEPPSAIPKHTTEPPSQGNSMETHSITIIVFTVSGCVVLLLGALLFCTRRKSSTDGPSMIEMKCRGDPSYSHSAQGADMLKAEEEKQADELHYASVTIVELDRGTSGNCKRLKVSSNQYDSSSAQFVQWLIRCCILSMFCLYKQTASKNDSVIYSTVNIK